MNILWERKAGGLFTSGDFSACQRDGFDGL